MDQLNYVTEIPALKQSCFFCFFVPALETICRKAEVLIQLVLAKYDELSIKLFLTDRKKPQVLTIKIYYLKNQTSLVNFRKT